MLNPIAKKLGHGVHAIVSRNRPLAEFYLAGLGRACRLAPDGPWKQFVMNSIASVQWPELRFREMKARFPIGDLEVNLIPHVDGLEFEALFYRRLRYEKEIFGWLATRSYRTIVEIGANVGLFSLFLARQFPQASVYSFEPSRKVFSRLLKNVAANACPNLFVFNCAIFSESGFLDFHEPVGHVANGSLSAPFASIFSQRLLTSPVPVLAASLIEPLFAQPPVLIKIDAEGAEPQLLQSLAGLIQRYRPDLLIEVLPATEAALNDLPFVHDGSYRLSNIRRTGLIRQERFIATAGRDYVLEPA